MSYIVEATVALIRVSLAADVYKRQGDIQADDYSRRDAGYSGNE